MPTVTGVTHHPDTDEQLVGFWTVDRYPGCPGCSDLNDLPEDLTVPVTAYAPGAGKSATVTLDATTGDDLYWARFTSSDRETVLGPYLFTLTEDRTWDDIIANPAPTPGGGGGVSGSAAWFTVRKSDVPLAPGRTYMDLAVLDDGRAEPRPDLIIVDPEDPTKLIVQAGGEYLIMLSPTVNSVVGAPAGLGQLEAGIEINDDNEAPAYYVNGGGIFALPFIDSRSPAFKPMIYQQTLVAGDVVEVTFRVGINGDPTDVSWTASSSTIAFTKLGE